MTSPVLYLPGMYKIASRASKCQPQGLRRQEEMQVIVLESSESESAVEGRRIVIDGIHNDHLEPDRHRHLEQAAHRVEEEQAADSAALRGLTDGKLCEQHRRDWILTPTDTESRRRLIQVQLAGGCRVLADERVIVLERQERPRRVVAF